MTVLVRAPSANTLGLYPDLDTRPPILALPSSLPSRQVRKENHSFNEDGRTLQHKDRAIETCLDLFPSRKPNFVIKNGQTLQATLSCLYAEETSGLFIHPSNSGHHTIDVL